MTNVAAYYYCMYVVLYVAAHSWTSLFTSLCSLLIQWFATQGSGPSKVSQVKSEGSSEDYQEGKKEKKFNQCSTNRLICCLVFVLFFLIIPVV